MTSGSNVAAAANKKMTFVCPLRESSACDVAMKGLQALRRHCAAVHSVSISSYWCHLCVFKTSIVEIMVEVWEFVLSIGLVGWVNAIVDFTLPQGDKWQEQQQRCEDYYLQEKCFRQGDLLNCLLWWNMELCNWLWRSCNSVSL